MSKMLWRAIRGTLDSKIPGLAGARGSFRKLKSQNEKREGDPTSTTWIGLGLAAIAAMYFIMPGSRRRFSRRGRTGRRFRFRRFRRRRR